MILLDPILLSPPSQSLGDRAIETAFWARIVEWASDKRVKIGAETHALIYAQYAEFGYPEHNLSYGNTSVRQEYQTAINRLLSRVQVHGCASGARSFEPRYNGNEAEHIALELDVSGTAGMGILGLATRSEHWATDSVWEVQISPAPPKFLECCFQAGDPLIAEKADSIQKFYRGLRVHIIGGQEDHRALQSISECLGIGVNDIIWIASEKAKPPRDLDKRWRHLHSDRDVTLCITGRVGHQTSGAAEKAAAKAGVPHVLVESQSDVQDALVNFALSNK